ncbi:MAG TPA: DUF3618 domain-containing protein [Gaiellaceae bacterium]|nr:DUF3618 domain-containing protein [Gaiellaceae bacterium]
MARRNGRTPQDVRREIASERQQLADAVDSLREGFDVTGKLREKLPVVAAGALGAGFVLAGGIGATMRLLARRSREGREQARFGRFSFVKRD